MVGIQNLTPFNSTTGSAAGKVGGTNKKGSKHINTHIQELLADEEFEATILDSKKGIVEYKGTPLKAILMAQMQLAINSKDEAIRIKATDLLLKHGWSQKIETDITSNGESIGMSDTQVEQLIRARADRKQDTA